MANINRFPTEAELENRGQWVAACGGSETPMTINNVRVLYCWNTASKRHAYMNLDTDMIMDDGDFELLRGY